MNPRIKFLLKFIAITISFLVLVVVLVMPQYSNEYMASLRDKFARVKSIEQPKIILVGGSNVAFGFDSELLEKEMAMPVVNFGLHANLSQTFPGDLLKSQIGPGDIVIIAPEYYDYLDDSCDYVMAWLAIENDWALFTAAIQSGHLDGLIGAFPTYFRRAMDRYLDKIAGTDIENELAREHFNEWGDYIAPRPGRIIEVGDTNSFVSTFLSDFLSDYWNDFSDFATAQGATLYMSSPPIVFEELSVDLEALQLQLESNLNFPVISQLSDYIYPLDYFYDTGFHLNDYGRRIRTEQLLEDLKTL
jgi:hypothetical protein